MGSLRTLISQGHVERKEKLGILTDFTNFLIPDIILTKEIVNKTEKFVKIIIDNMNNKKAWWKDGMYLFILLDEIEPEVLYLAYLKLARHHIVSAVIPGGQETVYLTKFMDKIFDSAYYEIYPVVHPEACISQDSLL